MVIQPRLKTSAIGIIAACVMAVGCAGLNSQPNSLPPSHYGLSSAPNSGQAVGSGVAPRSSLPAASVEIETTPVQPASLQNRTANGAPASFTHYRPTVASTQTVVRGQSPDSSWSGNKTAPGSLNHSRDPMPVSGHRDSSFVLPATTGYGHPQTQTRLAQYESLPPPTNTMPPPNNGGGTAPYGSDGFSPQRLPGVDPGFAPNGAFPENGMQMLEVDSPYGPTADFDVFVQETHTGRFMFGVGINSDAGLTGSVVIDERNFDITRIPTTFDEFVNGTAWRGAGQGFRLEAMPGTQVQRYMVSFTEPYMFGTDVSSSISGYLYDRNYFDYDERRAGGRLGFGYRLTPDLSISTSIRAEQVDITDPRSLVPPLVDVLGKSDLYSGRVALSHDTRDIPFSPTEGHFFEASYEHAFGDYQYPRFGLDFRKYFLMLERTDGSGRHVLSASFNLGISGEDTPMFENYYAGGYATLRGFRYRHASPKIGDVTVGGRFKFLGSVEYMIPITADDMLRFVAFCDYGTIERNIEIEDFRVAPGVGLRIFIPAMGPAPIALDFAFPVAKADTDQTEVFSFFIGFGR